MENRLFLEKPWNLDMSDFLMEKSMNFKKRSGIFEKHRYILVLI